MTKPHNPWEEFLNNCANGDNHFRSSEYQELIDFIDGIQEENASLKEQVVTLEKLQGVALIESLRAEVAQTEFRNERLVSDYASIQEELSTIRRIHVQNIAIKDAEIARWKTVPMKYRRMEFNAQLQAENASLRKEVEQLKSDLASEKQDYLECEHMLHSERDTWQNKISELTRQRDLAVSALEELTGVWYGKAVSDMALKALSTLKESEA